MAQGEAFVDHAAGGSVGGGALRLATNALQSFVGSNQYYNGALKYARNGGSSVMYFDTTSTPTAGDIVFQTAPNAAQDATMALSEALRIKQNGNVGIGLQSPPRKLSVANSLGVYGFAVDNSTQALTAIELANRGANGSSYGWVTYTAAVGGGFGVGPNGYEIWEYPNDTTKHCCHQRFVIQASRTGMQPTTPVVIDGYGLLQANVIRSMGDITAVGNISAGGVIHAKYQDVAEWVPVAGDDSVANGEVVVLDPVTPNTVRRSSSAYDTSVAGVVSPQPGVLLGEGAANKAMIATTGRVRIKAVALGTPIRIGDLLVTSPKPGIAMRSEPLEVRNGRALHQPGTIIGKALEPLALGEGEILVLLSLQ